ncbi:LPS export ABC transporter periplasmic protein LptC [Candidatus Poribacteria bacterium]|nr:LPS export ABC transporter periplasmic protein LptC [Candidatus Poribacteria bacterium]
MKILRFLIFIIIGIIFLGCGRSSDQQTAERPEDLDQEISQFSLLHAKDGRTRWKLNANKARFLESDKISVDDVLLVIYSDKNDETMTIKGDTGEINQRTDDIKIMGNVKGNSSNGGRLESEELYWRDKPGRIYTPPGIKVTIYYEDSIIVGEELDADPELETATLRNITGVTKSEEKSDEK